MNSYGIRVFRSEILFLFPILLSFCIIGSFSQEFFNDPEIREFGYRGAEQFQERNFPVFQGRRNFHDLASRAAAKAAQKAQKGHRKHQKEIMGEQLRGGPTPTPTPSPSVSKIVYKFLL